MKILILVCVTLAVLWVLCAAPTYHLFLSYWQSAYPQHAALLCDAHKAEAWRVARWGPVGLTAVSLSAVESEWHGLQWTCKEER